MGWQVRGSTNTFPTPPCIQIDHLHNWSDYSPGQFSSVCLRCANMPCRVVPPTRSCQSGSGCIPQPRRANRSGSLFFLNDVKVRGLMRQSWWAGDEGFILLAPVCRRSSLCLRFAVMANACFTDRPQGNKHREEQVFREPL